MKKLTKIISVVVVGCIAVAANAKPINLSFKSVSIAENSAELSRIETISLDGTAGVQDATQLKIMGASASRIFGNDPAAMSMLEGAMPASRARPVLVTQAMTMPFSLHSAAPVNSAAPVITGAPVNTGAQNTIPAAAGSGTAAVPDNDVLVVSEPPVLLLLALGMLLAGARRKA